VGFTASRPPQFEGVDADGKIMQLSNAGWGATPTKGAGLIRSINGIAFPLMLGPALSSPTDSQARYYPLVHADWLATKDAA
jgi:hypothetical protein